MKVVLLLVFLFCDCYGDFTSKCSVHTGIKWYDVQAVFDALDPCTPNPCAKGEVCRVAQDTYQHYCQTCNATNTTNGGLSGCSHKSSFENLLLMCYTGFYRALPWLRELPKVGINIPTNTVDVTGKVDACGSNPCKNGGKCISNNGDYKCDCTIPNTGKSCDEVFVMNETTRITTGNVASQSSGPDFHPANHALDNDPISFSHTAEGGSKPWWQVDLLVPYKIYGVQVANSHAWEWRLRDFEIRVGNTSMLADNTGKSNSLCHFHEGGGISALSTVAYYCKPDTKIGRYLTIQRVIDCSTEPHCQKYKTVLQLAEVRAYGYPVM